MHVLTSTRVLIDSGPPASHLATGTIISNDQGAGLWIPTTCTCRLVSVQLYLNTELAGDAFRIHLSLCKDLDQLQCVDQGIFEIVKHKRLQIEWQSSAALDGGSYWFILNGEGTGADSISWLDPPSFNATTAFSQNRRWIIEPWHTYSSTMIFTVRL
jgi:hypothetical protein